MFTFLNEYFHHLQENAALCDQVSQIQESIVTVKEERRFLLKKLMDLNPELALELSKKQNQASNESSEKPTHTRKPYKKRAKKNQDLQPVESISLDSNDAPSYPIELGSIKILNIGQIIYDRSNYHTDSWIYPSGFVSTRNYADIKNKDGKCMYTCRITENGDFPRFEIVPDSDSQFVIAAPTPDLCHAALIQTINENTGQNMELSAQGEWFFGLSQSAVISILENNPDIKKCSKFQGFNSGSSIVDPSTEHSLTYEALEKDITVSNYHTVLEVKEEPPDELFELTN